MRMARFESPFKSIRNQLSWDIELTKSTAFITFLYFGTGCLIRSRVNRKKMLQDMNPIREYPIIPIWG